jgi:hypothetical protein
MRPPFFGAPDSIDIDAHSCPNLTLGQSQNGNVGTAQLPNYRLL